MGNVASGPRDANSFHAAVRHGGDGPLFLPPASSLTYQGLFNQHTYKTGEPERTAAVAVDARVAYVRALGGTGHDAAADSELWVGLFIKSCRDGCPRDATPLDMVVVLDISGSMNAGMEGSTRLSVAKKALMELLAKLRENDRFGLATFTDVGVVIQELMYVKDLDQLALQDRIQALSAGGGTTIPAGMDAAVGICKFAQRPEGKRHQRLLFLTDMNDPDPRQLNDMIAAQAIEGRYVSFVGISEHFDSQLADEITKHPGSNYFCITRPEELQKTIVTDFDYNFFPVAFDVEVAQQSDVFDVVAVYGTPFDLQEEEMKQDWNPDSHKFYPAEFKGQAKELAMCTSRYTGKLPSPALQSVFGFLSTNARTIIRVDTVFPSAISEDAAIEGGLVLLRLRPRRINAGGTLKLMLRYSVDGEMLTSTQDLAVSAMPEACSYPPDSAVEKGVILQHFVEVCRSYLIKAADRSADTASEYAEGLRTASLHVDTLCADFDSRAESLDALCPGLRDELHRFQTLATKHYASITESEKQPFDPVDALPPAATAA